LGRAAFGVGADVVFGDQTFDSNSAAKELWNGTLQCGTDATEAPRPCTEIWDFLAAAGMNDTYLADDRAYGDTHLTAYDAVQLFKVFTSP